MSEFFRPRLALVDEHGRVVAPLHLQPDGSWSTEGPVLVPERVSAGSEVSPGAGPVVGPGDEQRAAESEASRVDGAGGVTAARVLAEMRETLDHPEWTHSLSYEEVRALVGEFRALRRQLDAPEEPERPRLSPPGSDVADEWAARFRAAADRAAGIRPVQGALVYLAEAIDRGDVPPGLVLVIARVLDPPK